ncbi:MAG: hypothetical protein AAF391_12570, partial [Bacteroidota bacterium]
MSNCCHQLITINHCARFINQQYAVCVAIKRNSFLWFFPITFLVLTNHQAFAQSEDDEPFLLKDIVNDETEFPTSSSYPKNLAEVNGVVVFQAKSHLNSPDIELWSTDGTSANTERIANLHEDIVEYKDLGRIQIATDENGKEWIYYTFFGPMSGIVRTDGTATGTQFIALPGESPIQVIVTDDSAYIASVHDNVLTLWRVRHAESEYSESIALAPSGLTGMRSMVYLDGNFYYTLAANSTSQIQLWMTDGISEGNLVRDGRIIDLVAIGNMLYFTVDEGGFALRRMNRGSEESELIHSFEPISAPSDISGRAETGTILQAFPEAMYYFAMDFDNDLPDSQLWKIDNSLTSPQLIEQFENTISLNFLNQNPADILLSKMIPGATHGSPQSDTQIWRLDNDGDHVKLLGTLTGSIAQSVYTEEKLYAVTSFEQRENALLSFSLDDGSISTIAELDSPSEVDTNHYFLLSEDNIYFPTNRGIYGTELWVSKKVTETLELTRDINRDVVNIDGSIEAERPISSKPGEFVHIGNYVYFTAKGPKGRMLWRTDGTTEGTALFADSQLGEQLHDIVYLLGNDSQLIFISKQTNVNIDPNLGINGDLYSIWLSDGSIEGTREIA